MHYNNRTRPGAWVSAPNAQGVRVLVIIEALSSGYRVSGLRAGEEVETEMLAVTFNAAMAWVEFFLDRLPLPHEVELVDLNDLIGLPEVLHHA